LKTVWLNLRHCSGDRADAFKKGLLRIGYKVVFGIPGGIPSDDDVFVTWNRIRIGDQIAQKFRHVIVAENATWGNDFAGQSWLHLARDHHNSAGKFPVGATDRWDALGVDLLPFRTTGETVIIAQRGIGSAPTAMPMHWPERALKRHGGRIRRHPGISGGISLDDDLSSCGLVVTWGSGAAVKALMMGIPVISEMPNWIAAQNNTVSGRLEMFRRLAWAQWTITEISNGQPFARLLSL
jgi:hypothetical protein